MMGDLGEQLRQLAESFQAKVREWQQIERTLAERGRGTGASYAQGNRHAYHDAFCRVSTLLERVWRQERGSL